MQPHLGWRILSCHPHGGFTCPLPDLKPLEGRGCDFYFQRAWWIALELPFLKALWADRFEGGENRCVVYAVFAKTPHTCLYVYVIYICVFMCILCTCVCMCIHVCLCVCMYIYIKCSITNYWFQLSYEPQSVLGMGWGNRENLLNKRNAVFCVYHIPLCERCKYWCFIVPSISSFSRWPPDKEGR